MTEPKEVVDFRNLCDEITKMVSFLPSKPKREIVYRLLKMMDMYRRALNGK